MPLRSGTQAYTASAVETRYVDSSDCSYAYRCLGAARGVPLLFLQRFDATMDDWDPGLLDIFAAERPIVVFDNAGIGRSTGSTASDFTGIAHAAALFATALRFEQIDVLGWSMGGYAASHLALDRPDLVRRLILASTGPGYLDDAPPIPSGKSAVERSPDEEYLALFFPDTSAGRIAGTEHLARLRLRQDRFQEPARPESLRAQLSARAKVMTPEGSLLPRMRTLACPTLVASGRDDVRIPSYYPFTAAQAMPDAKLIIYPGAAHGFIFQLLEEFGRDALGFLRD